MKTLKIEMIWKYVCCIYFFFRAEDEPRPAARLRRSSVSSSRASGSSHDSVPAYIPAPAPAAPRAAAQQDPGVMPVQLLVQQPGREHLPVLQPNPRRGHSTWLVFFLFVCFFPLINLLTCIFFKGSPSRKMALAGASTRWCTPCSVLDIQSGVWSLPTNESCGFVSLRYSNSSFFQSFYIF